MAVYRNCPVWPPEALRALRWINTVPGHGLLPSGVTAKVASWHKDDLRVTAPEGLLNGALPTFGAMLGHGAHSRCYGVAVPAVLPPTMTVSKVTDVRIRMLGRLAFLITRMPC